MVVHTAAQLVEYVSVPQLIGGTVAAAGIWSVKAWAGGRKCIWEREWAGKMIMVVGPPSTTVLSLIDTLLRLPSPPQILYLPPLPSPLPQDLLTVLHTLRLSTSNPQAQLHCEPLPPTARGVREFVKKWATAQQGTAGEGGRRVDAIVLAEGWEVISPRRRSGMRFEDITADRRKGDGGVKAEAEGSGSGSGSGTSTSKGQSDPNTDQKQSSSSTTKSRSDNTDSRPQTPLGASIDFSLDPEWQTSQFQFHLLTSLLPHLLQNAERDIRIINLISPGYAAALPSLQTLNSPSRGSSPLISSGTKGLTALLLMGHFARILDTLYASTFGKIKPIPKIDGDTVDGLGVGEEKKGLKERDLNVKSNIMAISVVMPWCRGDVLRGIWGADETWLRWFMYMIFFPLLLIFTPSPSKSIQSILYALSAPIRPGPLSTSSSDSEINSVQPIQPDTTGKVINKKVIEEEEKDPRRKGVAGGDCVRDCCVIDLPPVLCDPLVAKAHYEKIEKEVEEGVRQSHTRERAYPPKTQSKAEPRMQGQ